MKGFIEQLTNKQIKAFLDDRFLIYRYKYSIIEKDSNEKCIAVQLYAPDGTIRDYELDDFSSTLASPQWISYLNTIFGRSYETAYSRYKEAHQVMKKIFHIPLLKKA